MEDQYWTVSQLWMYPIKSCKGVQVQEARIAVHGMEWDRQFMIVDAKTGMFAAQRADSGLGIGIKSMCLINAEIKGDPGTERIEVSAPGMETITIYPNMFIPVGGRQRQVQVWKSECDALIADADTNQWFTEFLSCERPGKYQLVKFPYRATRRAKHGYSQLRYADGYPFLVISQESLDDLNKRIGGVRLPINRFRPNIVITKGRPYDEDRLDRMVINGVDFEGMELCVRCPITTTDQETGGRGKEPLATLATYRRNPAFGKSGVVFGRNFNHLSCGTIRIGDRVDFLRYQQFGPCDGKK